MWHYSADTGGTFTDCYALAPGGLSRRCKVLSAGCLRSRLVELLPGRQARLADDWDTGPGFLVGFELATVQQHPSFRRIVAWEPAQRLVTLEADPPSDWLPGDLVELRTGEEAPVLGARLLTGTAPSQPFPSMQMRLATTRATNALLERKGSRVALFITQGFGDLLAIGDQRRACLFALRHQPRTQFHEVSVEVEERLDARGHVVMPLDERSVRKAAAALRRDGIEHAAVALLHSFVQPVHELRVAEILREEGFQHVSLSSELAPFAKILPRAQSAVANAYLTGPVQGFLQRVAAPLGNVPLQVMTSAGGLEQASAVRPMHMLLSGPAGGVIGAANAARRAGHSRIITFDMGGTSTDVARLEGRPGYRFTQNIEGMSLLVPSVAVETVAAGGGSICAWTSSGLAVGPHSAGSSPGPACYGRGGPLTVTDVNLLLGRFDPNRSPIPLDRAAAEQRLSELHDIVCREMPSPPSLDELLHLLLALAVEHMADAIRRISVAEGYAPQEYALLAFGGAGPQHACAVAAKLGITTIIVPRNAGILSAVGLYEAAPEAFAEKQVLMPLDEAAPQLGQWVAELAGKARSALQPDTAVSAPRLIAELRLQGQDTPVQIETTDVSSLGDAYREAYLRLFGYAPPDSRVVELVSLRVAVRAVPQAEADVPLVPASDALVGPHLIQDGYSTLVVDPGWTCREYQGYGHVLTLSDSRAPAAAPATSPELLRHRFHSLVDDMGALLKRTSISTNIRERLDFSYALLDARGRLIASAPHIPVHLGALGVCVREVVKALPPLLPGDTCITNHPAFGGSHLPDVTLITPVFGAAGELLAYVANRAHHAEIGGLTPGSMPAHAHHLVEEGVVIAPRLLVRGGEPLFDDLATLLAGAPHPTRNLADNLADLHAQLAANRLGAERLGTLASPSLLRAAMDHMLAHSGRVMRRRLEQVPQARAEERLDDGALIQVAIVRNQTRLVLDFTGTSPTHGGNLNATRAIVSSAVLYVLRLMLQEDLPLNEGLMEPVELVLPEGCFLNPVFSGDATRDPAVVGGNVEVSQRLVDTLIKAFGLQACSQGTMNNLLFGNDRFGYYETVAGGAGAGEGYAGASALHTHMTNTAITDPEILEQRYPVRLRCFSIRRGSGGQGRWRGGDGVIREFEFLEPLTVSLLTQHRHEGPFGIDGGSSGAPGMQTLLHPNDSSEVLPPSTSLAVNPGDRLRLETPGGGGCGIGLPDDPGGRI